MNDFTKEELLLIQENIVVPDERELRSAAKDLYFKVSEMLIMEIREMIANYCEHIPEWEFDGCYYKCAKCGVLCK